MSGNFHVLFASAFGSAVEDADTSLTRIMPNYLVFRKRNDSRVTLSSWSARLIPHARAWKESGRQFLGKRHAATRLVARSVIHMRVLEQGPWQIEADLMLLANLQLLCSFLLFRLQKENNER